VTHSLEGVTQAAQALILFTIGMGLDVDRIRALRGRGFRLSGLEIGLTFCLAALALLLVSGFAHVKLSLSLVRFRPPRRPR
jgi:Kef-type K+ transport system membrane component KefB